MAVKPIPGWQAEPVFGYFDEQEIDAGGAALHNRSAGAGPASSLAPGPAAVISIWRGWS